MRQLFREQLSLSVPGIDHPHARELEAIDDILRNHPGMVRLVLQDLTRGVTTDEGREGMTAEQVLLVAIIRGASTRCCIGTVRGYSRMTISWSATM